MTPAKRIILLRAMRQARAIKTRKDKPRAIRTLLAHLLHFLRPAA